MKELAVIQSKLNAPKNQYNRFGGYKYRSCEDILAAVKPLLEETETTLTITDDIVSVGNRIYVKAQVCIKNKAGETETTTAFAREEESKKGMDGSQVTGAASSYARKYALNGLFAIDDAKDSDATNTHGKDNQSPNPSSGIDAMKESLAKISSAKTDQELVAIWEQYSAINPSLTMAGTEFYNAWIKRRGELAR